VTTSIMVRHTFEAAHRLPNVNAKCASLHGHSWGVTVRVEAPDVDDRGIIVDFGPLKAGIREWIDTNLDHGSMLSAADPLVRPLLDAGCKVFRFGGAGFTYGLPDGYLPLAGESYAGGLPHPTVELVAYLLFAVAHDVLTERVLTGRARRGRARVAQVDVTEKHDNASSYSPVPLGYAYVGPEATR
jgi:6-pyruvoyltetrahydropterin/6-carboxytetrahydropterin synthase